MTGKNDLFNIDNKKNSNIIKVETMPVNG